MSVLRRPGNRAGCYRPTSLNGLALPERLAVTGRQAGRNLQPNTLRKLQICWRWTPTGSSLARKAWGNVPHKWPLTISLMRAGRHTWNLSTKKPEKVAVDYFSLSVGQRKLVRDQIRYSTLNSKNFMIFKSLTGFRKDHDRAKHQELTPYPQLGFSRRKYPAQRVGKGSAGMSQIVSTGTEIEAMVISSVCQGVSHLLIRQRPAARNNVGVTLPAL